MTVTVKEQVAVTPAESVAVQLTVVVPFEKVEPDAGEQVTVEPGGLLGIGKSTTREHSPGAADVTMSARQVIAGGDAAPAIFTMNASIPATSARWNAPGLAGKFTEAVSPVTYVAPLESTAMENPSSEAVPPRYVE